ncbi:MAG: S1 family peptidase [Burkholderiales bacterium]
MRLRAPLRRIAAMTMLLAASLPAHAIVGGSVDPNDAGSQWGGVGSVRVGNGAFSGVLIAPGYVLTAQHVVGASSPSELSFQLNLGASGPTVLKVSEVFLASGFPGFGAGSASIPANDLAILRLAADAPVGTPSYSIGAAPTIGEELRIIGYGEDGASPADAGRKRIGSNLVDRFIPTIGASGIVSPAGAYWFDFDAGPSALPGEGTLGVGDSGGPAFVMRNGAWQLVGINTFSAQSSAALMLGGGGLALDGYRAWIDAVIHPVPEPATYAMLLAGLVVLGLGKLGYRRERSVRFGA